MSEQIREPGRGPKPGPQRGPLPRSRNASGIDFFRYLPWVVVTVAAIYLLLAMTPPDVGPKEMQLYRFGQLPVLHRGRIKPIDTVARTSLLVISNRQTWRDKAGNTRPATEWLLDAMTAELSKKRPAPAESHAVFRIDNDQLLALLELKEKPGNFRYSLTEIAPRMAEFDDKAGRAVQKEPADRDLLDRKVLDLRRNLEIYLEFARWREPFMVPPRGEGQSWQPFMQAVAHEKSAPEPNPDVESLGNILLAYSRGDVASFNTEVARYRERLEQARPDDVRLARLEAAFNHFEPFFQCSILYLFIFLLSCAGFISAVLRWGQWQETLRQTAFWLALLTLVVHTSAIIARMYIGGRPPVTNLYSSAVFIGWAAVILGLITERLYGLSLGNLVAGVAGSITVLIAHFLGTSGDTLDVLQAVLDTNFWLATHVTCITLGYSATYFAGIVGMIFIALGIATPVLTRDLMKILGQVIYGVTCFALFLSFTGTVLGGIWADQSWGRFWGWDPKENGALLIVLINAILVHARWGGMIQQRGMAVVSVIGNIVTTWSWFGVNMLGVGLHSYGFMDGAVLSMIGAMSTFGVFSLAGAAVPTQYWRSFNAAPAPQARPRLKPA
jgi:ABC-type transport system involved in cytochrome c biogenesis permease subunit